MVVVFGYLALTSTTNQGTAFPLPWIPALLVLAVAAAASVRVSAVRAGLAALLITVCAFNLLVKNGVSQSLSEPVVTSVPVIGDVTVLDGRDILYKEAQEIGYPVEPPPAQLPAEQRQWGPFYQRVARRATGYADARREQPYVIVASEEGFVSDTRVVLASVAEDRRLISAAAIPRPVVPNGPEVALYYWQQLKELIGNLPRGYVPILLTADPPDPSLAVRPAPGAVAKAFGFRPLRRVRMPGSRTATLWRLAVPASAGGDG